MELRQVEHFLAVVRHRSFTRAAHEVHVVQSALSASIRKLEADLGADLFDRTTRRVTMTSAGEALLAPARRIVADAEAARGEVAAVAGLVRGQVSIGTIQTLTAVDLPALLGQFRGQYPAIRIRVREGTDPVLTAAVLAGELDLSFVVTTDPLPDGLTGFASWDQRLVLLTHPGHRLAARRRVRLAELAGEPFVDFAGSGLQALVDRAFASAGIRREPACEASHVPLLVDLVAAGLGSTVVPESVAQRSGLPFARVVEPALSRTIHLVGRAAELTIPAARALLAHLLG
ncbi:LysR family transcriptional regulator [Amycolatopsis jiangsuensis]|uniref:DNA-binding transcriptional LysR family regulator n=1 Tax=Amycolatopsis jiangsuensis TaxID=1181879 RepID=A0A840J5H7_9PSEU|nr:LysR family transcriptional regulator [Amycolatopsis jiangsuensis]MBB4688677.1 DNA-binding transcriptional LysR family regulator [Amycolatopsis jiangsuensis]